MPTRFKQLERILKSPLDASRTEYQCIHLDDLCTVFAPTANTGKVMIPTDLELEWISAYELGHVEMDPRTMRDKIKEHSDWATYHMGLKPIFTSLLKPGLTRNILKS